MSPIQRGNTTHYLDDLDALELVRKLASGIAGGIWRPLEDLHLQELRLVERLFYGTNGGLRDAATANVERRFRVMRQAAKMRALFRV